LLDADRRCAILTLAGKGHGVRTIARAVGVSRNAVRRVLESGSVAVTEPVRPEQLTPALETIRDLYGHCRGNRVRVWEELAASGTAVPYTTLTGFMRRHGIGVAQKERAGSYHFAPGEEMQHDTSPHDVAVGERKRRLQCAALILCHSRMLFSRCYPTFNRFFAKIFLTEALLFMGGAARRCVIDNTSIVIAHGTGRKAVIAPEMEAFCERFGFTFLAHAVGDANRKGRIERPFSYVENNFYPGRTFTDLSDLNRQMAAWCEKVNAKGRRHLGGSAPVTLFQSEKPHLLPLPLYVPEVYALHPRVVDLEGMVNLHNNRYSVPEDLIGRRVEVRETKDKVTVMTGHALAACHDRMEDGAGGRSVLPEHRHKGRPHRKGEALPAMPEEKILLGQGGELEALAKALRQKCGRAAIRAIRHLHRMYLDYPADALKKAAAAALSHGLFDTSRIERMVLRTIAGEFFQLPLPPTPGIDENPGGNAEKETGENDGGQ
jgi:transposase